MTGATIIWIIFGIFAAAVVGGCALFFGRIIWAMRNPEKFKEFQEREIAAEKARRQKYLEAESERQRLGKASWAGLIFGAVFSLAGLLIVALAAWQIYEIARGQFWTETRCTMLRSGIVSSTSSRSATTYRPDVEYSYSFDGRNYTGNRLTLPGISFSSSDEARQAIEDYPRGATVACYVNSSLPSESVLDRSPLHFSLHRNVLGMLIAFGIGGFLIYVSRPRRKLQTDLSNDIEVNKALK